jgi:hypothetical protein
MQGHREAGKIVQGAMELKATKDDQIGCAHYKVRTSNFEICFKARGVIFLETDEVNEKVERTHAQLTNGSH